jgi:hypothetical protein
MTLEKYSLHCPVPCPLPPSPHISPTRSQSFEALLDVGTDAIPGKVELAEDCSADPWAPSCHRPSLMDMINGVGHRAQVRTNTVHLDLPPNLFLCILNVSQPQVGKIMLCGCTVSPP